MSKIKYWYNHISHLGDKEHFDAFDRGLTPY